MVWGGAAARQVDAARDVLTRRQPPGDRVAFAAAFVPGIVPRPGTHVVVAEPDPPPYLMVDKSLGTGDLWAVGRRRSSSRDEIAPR